MNCPILRVFAGFEGFWNKTWNKTRDGVLTKVLAEVLDIFGKTQDALESLFENHADGESFLQDVP